MFYSYRKFKKTSNKGSYIVAFFGLIIVIWVIIACIGLNIESKIVTKDIVFLNKSVDLVKKPNNSL